jgi:lysyl-tRNA synthetase class 2
VTENPSTPATEDDLPEQMKVRRDKRTALLDEGAKPYPLGIKRTATLAELRAEYEALEPGAATGREVTVARHHPRG